MSEASSPEQVIVRMSFREALGMTARLFAVVLAAMIFQVLRASEPLDLGKMLTRGAILLSVLLALAWIFRRAFRVTVTKSGLLTAFRRRPVLWSEIASVDHGRVALGKRGFHLRSLQRETQVVMDSVARDPAFRAALDAWAPPAHVVRALLDPGKLI